MTRRWIGIDISPLAVRLVRARLQREVPLFTQGAIERTDVPLRTDLVDEVREYLNEKRALYGQQEGICAGCRVHFELRNMEVDHVIPRVKGGPNLLRCAAPAVQCVASMRPGAKRRDQRSGDRSPAFIGWFIQYTIMV